MNCMMAIKALKVKNSAMPKSTRVSPPLPRRRANSCSSMAVAKASAKALAETIHVCGTPGMPMPRMIARAAPNVAAEDRPSVNGLASELLRMVCISAPASDSAMPTRTAIKACGSRTSQMMTVAERLSPPGARMPRMASPALKEDGPVTISSRKAPSVAAARRHRMTSCVRVRRRWPESAVAAAAPRSPVICYWPPGLFGSRLIQ